MKTATVLATFLLLSVLIDPTSGQIISTACTNSLLGSFTPCLNFLTNSTNGGGSPSSGCCSALSALIRSGTSCLCLIVTGSIPFSLPINRQLAITLPRLCNSRSVPLQCQASATPLPSPGPEASPPSLPPIAPSADTEPDAPPPLVDEVPISPPPANVGQRPLLQLPNSAVKLSIFSSPAVIVTMAVGVALLN